MNAGVGDHITVHSRTAGQPTREGEVLEVRHGQQQQLLRVRWEDGSETLFAPSLGVAKVAAEDEEHEVTIRLDSSVELTLTEVEGRCECVATLRTTRGTFTGEGEARRRPGDPDVPMIGEELATSRALAALAAELADAAQEALSDGESRPVHLIT